MEGIDCSIWLTKRQQDAGLTLTQWQPVMLLKRDGQLLCALNLTGLTKEKAQEFAELEYYLASVDDLK